MLLYGFDSVFADRIGQSTLPVLKVDENHDPEHRYLTSSFACSLRTGMVLSPLPPVGLVADDSLGFAPHYNTGLG